jgi:outer membrane usher protein
MASIDHSRRNGSSGTRVGATGGLAITGAGVMPSRRLERSFAVVQVADLEGVTVMLDNQPMGRTAAKGRVLVDSLRPYDRNAISIDPADVPLDATLDTDSVPVTPAYRSGGLLEFPVKRARAATMRLVQQDGRPVPAGAEVTLAGQSFPVALDGLLYVADAGERSTATARWRGGQCSFLIERPASADPVPDLGAIPCRAGTPVTGAP